MVCVTSQIISICIFDQVKRHKQHPTKTEMLIFFQYVHSGKFISNVPNNLESSILWNYINNAGDGMKFVQKVIDITNLWDIFCLKVDNLLSLNISQKLTGGSAVLFREHHLWLNIVVS